MAHPKAKTDESGQAVKAGPIVRILGVRHHGPGSARSVVRALEEMKPDAILIEGPPDANDLIPLAGRAEFEPPVAILVYLPDKPQHAAFYPFAEFSPEWQAIRFGLAQELPVRFIDLPQAHQLGEPEPDPKPEPQSSEDQPSPTEDGEREVSCPVVGEDQAEEQSADVLAAAFRIRRDPLKWLAEAAGYDDGERWWEHLVEHRRDASGDGNGNSGDVFAAISEAMSTLRESLPDETKPHADLREAQREAFMRQAIRAALREGFQRIAVVCGAWHAPALNPATMPPAKDTAQLKNLPKVKVQAAWVPWTHGRLCRDSGYGAGIDSPGWYHHLWTAPDRVVSRWLTRVARLLRDQDLDASSAHIIEAVRLAEAMAALHGRVLPDLSELNDAVQAIFCFGEALPMRLIHDKLIVGETLGKVPADIPTVPLQQDLTRLQKRLKLEPRASREIKTFDLRKPTDLDRSHLLYRLRLLGISWGELSEARGKGTFKEVWQLQWQPEFAVAVIEAAAWGNTVEGAASARTCDLAGHGATLPVLTKLLDDAILAELPETVRHIMERVQAEAALASDVTHLMDALPPLAGVLRYGNVRQTDTAIIAHVVSGLVARIAVGLPAACFSLNGQAAEAMFDKLLRVDAAINLIQNPEHQAAWHGALTRMLDQPGLHGLVAGRCARVLLDAGAIDGEEAARRLNLSLSRAVEPAQAAAWIEGLLKGSGLLLLHDRALWDVLDVWISGLPSETFSLVLPLLRRTFSTFTPPERRQMGQRAESGQDRQGVKTGVETDLDLVRAEAVLPLLSRLLGIVDGLPS
jgi:Family of unknown function (DUF5682)